MRVSNVMGSKVTPRVPLTNMATPIKVVCKGEWAIEYILSPLRSNGDQRQISLCNINHFSVRKVMRILIKSICLTLIIARNIGKNISVVFRQCGILALVVLLLVLFLAGNFNFKCQFLGGHTLPHCCRQWYDGRGLQDFVACSLGKFSAILVWSVLSHFVIRLVVLCNKKAIALFNNRPSHFVIKKAVAFCNNTCRTL